MKIIPVGTKLVTYRTKVTRRGIKTLEVRKTVSAFRTPRKAQPLRSPSTFESAYRHTFTPEPQSPIPALKVKNVSVEPLVTYGRADPRPRSPKMIIYVTG